MLGLHYKTSVTSKRDNRVLELQRLWAKSVMRALFVVLFRLMIDHDAARQIRFIVAAGLALNGLPLSLWRHRFDVDRLYSSNKNDALKGVIIMRLFWSGKPCNFPKIYANIAFNTKKTVFEVTCTEYSLLLIPKNAKNCNSILTQT